MRVMVMHKVDDNMEAGRPPPGKLVAEMGALVQESIASGLFVDGAGLHRSARRVRVEFAGGKRRSLQHGPYAGGNELVAQFVMIEAESIEHAVEVSARLGAALGDGEIEIGPVVEPWDLGLATKPEGVPSRFLLLVKGDAKYEAGGARPQLAPVIDELVREGIAHTGAALDPTSSGARYTTRGGKRAWTDGPFTEAKELIAGFSVLEVASLAEARPFTERYAEILGENEVDVRVVTAR